LQGMQFDNRFLRELPGDPESGPRLREVAAMWSRVEPTPVAAPRLLAHSAEMASELGLSTADVEGQAFALVFGGNALLPGMAPYATNYGGHQFGHWAGQLGDGRAITLGEALVPAGRRELQLKGAGRTPYSRSADGRAVLRSSIREFLCSEAMHHLGIPTTRALSLVATGEPVVRDMFYDGHPAPEPGAIVCRVAPSFIRFGHFELPYSRGDTPLLRQLADFTIARDFPELGGTGEALYGDWFAEVCRRTARLVAGWMRVGFVHGVLNTDNMSILGLTIDYGPYGWIDAYDPDWTPNTTDAQGRRYRFAWQPKIAHWNLVRLAQALSPLFDDLAPLQSGLDAYAQAYADCERDNVVRKLGLAECRDGDMPLMDELQRLMHEAEVDMTLFFRSLSGLDPATATVDAFDAAFYDPARRDSCCATTWRSRRSIVPPPATMRPCATCST
jgi:serine/tyrosine/threonine adenylyltransferase